jgi:hypothetical protein
VQQKESDDAAAVVSMEKHTFNVLDINKCSLLINTL